jgi:four helix bundle protein
MSKNQKEYDLADRTTNFAVEVIALTKKLPGNAVGDPIKRQLVKSGTSIGANYAESRKDFRHKIGIAAKEARETKYWLEVIGRSFTGLKEPVKDLHTEADELYRIFVTIRKKAQDQ